MTKKNKHAIKIEELQKKMAKETGMSHEEVVKGLDQFINSVEGICKKMAAVFFLQAKETGLKNSIIAGKTAPLTFLVNIINLVHKESGIEPNIIYPDLFDAYERLLRMVVMLKPAYAEMPWLEFEKLMQKRYKDMGHFNVEIDPKDIA